MINLSYVALIQDQQLLACGHLLQGRSDACIARHDTALVHLEQAVKILRDLGNLPAVAVAVNGLGMTHAFGGDYATALSHYSEALDLARRHDLPDLAASVRSNMSVSHLALGQLEQALAAAERSAAWVRQAGVQVAIGVMNLGGVNCIRGDYAEAIRCADEAIAVARETGDRQSECEALLIRSEAALRNGEYRTAEADMRSALATADRHGYRYAAAAAQRQRARILATTERSADAEHANILAAEAYAQLNGAYHDALIELLLSGSPRQDHGER